MTLHQLKLFVTVARLKSIKAAAEELRTAQPSISRQVQLLADDVGVALHRRVGNGIELTPAGRFFAEQAELIVSRIDNLTKRFSGTLPAKKSVELTVGGGYGPSAKLLPMALTRFREMHPGISIYLRTDNREAIEKLLLRGHLDVGVIINARRRAGIVVERYRTEPCLAFVGRHNPLGKARRLKPGLNRVIRLVLRRQPLGGGISERYLRSLEKLGFKLEVIMYSDSSEAIKTAVATTSAVGILTQSTIGDDIKRGAFKRIILPGKQFDATISIVYPKNRQLSPMAREFIQLLRSGAGRDTPYPSTIFVWVCAAGLALAMLI